MYSAVSAVYTSSRSKVPASFCKFVRILGPFLIFDLLQSQRSKKSKKNNRRKKPNRSRPSPKVTNEVELQMGTTMCSESEANGTDLVNDLRMIGNEKITWATVGALLDRCYFVLYCFITCTVLLLSFNAGYAEWSSYSGLDRNATVMSYVCAQAALQGDEHAEAICKPPQQQ
jgi:hypothetical protein